MPGRPIQHQIADQAVASVTRVWTKIGAAVDVVHHDYGDDLLVQTCLNGHMDASRLWVQVKGTADAADMMEAGRRRSIRVGNPLALRWARTADMVIIVIWDVTAEIGWFGQLPADLDQADLVDNPRGTTEIHVQADNAFDVESAETISWIARLEHADKAVRAHLMRAQHSEQLAENSDDDHRDANAIVFSMMVDLGILEARTGDRYHFSNRFNEFVLERFRENGSTQEDNDYDGLFNSFGQAVLESIIWMSGKAGIQGTLLVEMTRAAMAIYRPLDGWPVE